MAAALMALAGQVLNTWAGLPAAEALGGRLALAETPTATFRLQLPRR